MAIPRVLIIAGSDSGGGAGIQADLKTVSALGAFGMTAITALTAQNTTGVYGVVEMPPEFVAQQIDVVVKDIGVDAVKTGMLSNAAIIEAVASKIREYHLSPVVVDPVMIAKSGSPLLRPEAIDALKGVLLTVATVVTPNLHEARALTGMEIEDISSMREAAKAIHALGPQYVVVKGGHLKGEAVDVLFDGQQFYEFRAERVNTHNTHGTGCVYASAIAAGLAKGKSVVEAVKEAKEFVTMAVRHSLALGQGHGPVNPMAWTFAPQAHNP
ncbi:MAG: bifunctional hydroxymethylpyrimidine kinase/phosphomethylpyrimidine kinase [Armatimonadota bacterium]|nr:bifunctional hydroxymethylpyrimidine kinase/phosphomethylpyrimidine kinase [Armatimonadota bacterium]MDR5704151.1 bifunctional hydroxymethylpyrimidine kinase/phosphomethylpyrimidine kinase [Armatimonadota bacterium]MDR7433658.1 bifunctional hydroxymethylpyrimidine kinase/phosphomethylpyrimidine kinase [Armatimonadota bacterium]